MEREIREIERDGRRWTAIRIGREEFGVPKHLLQGEKKEGIITDGSSIRPWYWEGLATIDGWRYVYFDSCRIEPVDTITTAHRSDALMLVNRIAFAIEHADAPFLDPDGGIIPLYRIFIYEGSQILIIPPDLADIMSVMIDEETKNEELTALIQGNAEMNFRLVSEMAQLLYYAASGTLPFSRSEIRESGYREVPLSFYQELDEKTEGLIAFILHARTREMRDIAGNRKAEEVLSWFIERSTGLEWNLENRTREECTESVRRAEESEKTKEFLEKSGKKARRNAFWRVKGTVITVSAVIAIALAFFLTSYISNLLEPPVTADMDQEEIIETVYEAQSNLDPQTLEAAVKGFELPQSMEVTNLYVASRARSAYESFNPAIDVNKWIGEGRPAIPNTSFIYGVVLESVEKTGENQYTATGVWYTPYSYEEDEEEEVITSLEDIPIYRYRVTQTFSFTWNNRGWWNITGSEITGYEELERERVEIYVP